MRFLVFPPGYDPMIALQGGPNKRKPEYSREQVQRQQLLFSLAKVTTEEPKDDRWFHPLAEE